MNALAAYSPQDYIYNNIIYLYLNIFPIAVRLAKGEEIALGPSVLGALYRDLSFIKNEMRAVIFKSKVLQIFLFFNCGLGRDGHLWLLLLIGYIHLTYGRLFGPVVRPNIYLRLTSLLS